MFGRRSCRRLIPFALAVLVISGESFGQDLIRASETAAGVGGNDESRRPAISADGRFVVFASDASNLVAGDTNGVDDIFLFDRTTGAIELLSKGIGGVPANGKSDRPTISADGQVIAFYSDATNLIVDDTNLKRDIFAFDRSTGVIELISVATDGRRGDKSSNMPSISADGRYVAFRSNATTLVTSDTNGFRDIFVRDRVLKTTDLISVTSSGGQATGGDSDRPAISADGCVVAFFSDAGNLVPDDEPTFDPLNPTQGNGFRDVFVRDWCAGTTERVSVSSDGTAGNGESSRAAISADGTFVAFRSRASNLVANDTNGADDVFLHDRLAGTTVRVSLGNGGIEADGPSSVPSVSSDARFIAFRSLATNLVSLTVGSGFEQVYVYDRETMTVSLVSVNASGVEGDGDSSRPVLSGDATVVAFHSLAANLIDDDDPSMTAGCPTCSGSQDVFVRVIDPTGGAGDSDADGVADVNDNCPTDSNPSQRDSDGDGQGDVCDDDRDGDGTPNAGDACPDDPAKTQEGVCGCGTPDSDDGQGGIICVDGCPNDPNKTAPGVCGCGFPDIDDGNGNIVCEDNCPDDPHKTSPGVCGCGVADDDTDGDGTPDCEDGCPDSAFKIDPGICGCQKLDTDFDGDGVPNCNDNCNATPNPDQVDSDADGLGDACDEMSPEDDAGNGDTGDETDDGSGGDGAGQSVPDEGQSQPDATGVGSPCGAVGMIPLFTCFLGLTALKRRR